MPSGKRDQRVQFYSRAEILDGGGGRSIDWQARFARGVHAAIRPLSGPEAYSMMQIEERGLYEVTIKNVRSITINDKLIWETNGNKELVIKDLRNAGPRDVERMFIAQEGPVAPDSA